MSQTELIVQAFASLFAILFVIISGGWVFYFIIKFAEKLIDNNNQIDDILEQQSEHDTYKITMYYPVTDANGNELIGFDYTGTIEGIENWIPTTIEPTDEN